MSPEPSPVSTCWDCGAASPWRRIAVESVIHARSKGEGGPYRTYQCPACRIDVGALPGPLGGWMLYPLTGLEEPGLLDRLLPAAERRALDRAHRWWRRNSVHVERFRRGIAEPGAATSEQEPPRGRAAAKAAAPRTQRERTPPRESPPGSGSRGQEPRRGSPARAVDPLRAALDVAADADLPEIRRAYRTLAKRWHPDRVGGDSVAQREAARRFREIRAAYEALVAELS